MALEILRTEDFVECLDVKIKTSSAHPEFDVSAGESYDDELIPPATLDKILAHTSSAGQKEAIDQTISAPNSSNPVVLKNDISTYYPLDDLGQFKDSVNTAAELPLIGNSLNDMIPVIVEQQIYRWDGTQWILFIQTGTLDHTSMSNQNGNSDYQHLAMSEVALLTTPANTHEHANTLLLDQIASAGSGIIIFGSERLLIPSSGDGILTSNEKSALSHTFGGSLPSTANKYVTSVDPRLNTIKNPYITLGLPGSNATYECSSILELELAFDYFISADSRGIKALEVLPGDYPLEDGTITWVTKDLLDLSVWPVNTSGAPVGSRIFSTSPYDTVVIEALATRQSTFNVAPLNNGEAVFTITGIYTGFFIVRGVIFVLGGTETLVALLERDNCIFEDCTFTSKAGTDFTNLLQGVRVSANGCKFIRCVFTGDLVKGLEIVGDNCLVEGCTFNMDSAQIALEVKGNGCKISCGNFVDGKIVIDAVYDTIMDRNALSASVVVEDSGHNTKWLSGLAQDYQQAYIGRTRTVGNFGSYADFRGSDETPFLYALADPFTTEIEVFEGTFTFSAPVPVPSGKKIKAIKKHLSYISGSFVLSDNSCLSGLSITSTTYGVEASSSLKAKVDNCLLNSSGASSSSINAQNCTDFKISYCTFTGVKGITLESDLRTQILNNRFTSGISVSSVSSFNMNYGDNIEEGSTCFLGCTDSVIYNNQFIDEFPTKLATLNSLWKGNYPAEANNENGIDDLEMPIGNLLAPIVTSGCYLGTFLGTAAMAFIETGMPTATAMSMKIGARVDTTTNYKIRLSWIATAFSGWTKWQISVTFRDRTNQDIGSTVVGTVKSQRQIHATGRTEEMCELTFSNYGSLLLDISHVSVTIKRLGDDPEDTLAGIAYLTNATLILPRN